VHVAPGVQVDEIFPREPASPEAKKNPPAFTIMKRSVEKIPKEVIKN
jgi:hypothetical protein